MKRLAYTFAEHPHLLPLVQSCDATVYDLASWIRSRPASKGASAAQALLQSKCAELCPNFRSVMGLAVPAQDYPHNIQMIAASFVRPAWYAYADARGAADWMDGGPCGSDASLDGACVLLNLVRQFSQLRSLSVGSLDFGSVTDPAALDHLLPTCLDSIVTSK